MKAPLLILVLPLALLVSCQSPPGRPTTSPPGATRPTTLTEALAQGQAESKAHRLGQAWVLVANQEQTSGEKTDFLASVQTAWQAQLAQARAQGKARLTQDLEATLALIQTGHWEATPPASPGVASTDPQAWLQGTATVFVDRGLQIEDGAGVPGIVLGSGFFISPDGLMLTNNHVIEALTDPKDSIGSKLWVALPDSKGVKTPARLVGWDRNLDLALLKVDTKPAYVFSLGTGDDPFPGQKLQAIGSPGGLEQTLTAGVASGQKRPLLALGEVLQIDVPVNPGNSGGPLLDESGRVVGIVFAGIPSFRGVNFAIPASWVAKDLPRLQVGGAAVLPWVGLGLQEDPQGLEVLYVTPQSPADWAGIQIGDRVTQVAGTPVTEIAAAQARILDFGTAAVLPVGLVRQGKPLTVWTTLAQRPEFPLEVAAKQDLVSKVTPLAFGLVPQGTPPGNDRVFTVHKVWPGSAADDLSLAPGDSVEVLHWNVSPKDHTLRTQWKLRRAAAKDQDAVVDLATTTAVSSFL